MLVIKLARGSDICLGNFRTEEMNERGKTLPWIASSIKSQREMGLGKVQITTKSEIDFIITDKQWIIKNPTVFTRYSTGNDHRMVRADIKIDVAKETYRMIKKSTKRS